MKKIPGEGGGGSDHQFFQWGRGVGDLLKIEQMWVFKWLSAQIFEYSRRIAWTVALGAQIRVQFAWTRISRKATPVLKVLEFEYCNAQICKHYM
jgi:hypothetical protein